MDVNPEPLNFGHWTLDRLPPEPSQRTSMKKLLTAIAVAVFVIYPSVSFASYIIHLKSGHSFQTDRYYEEGDQIKFKRYGGIIGIQKELVKDIEEVEDLPSEKEPDKQPVPETGGKEDGGKQGAPGVAQSAEDSENAKGEGESEKGYEQESEAETHEEGDKGKDRKVEGKGSEEERKKAKKERAAEIETFLKEKREIMEELNLTFEAFKEAKAKNDKAAAKKHFRRLASLREKRKKLEKKVKVAFGGKLPNWWQE